MRAILCLAFMAICSSWLPAQSFSSSNLQVLGGTGFDDRATGASTASGDLLTLSAERLDVRPWGDSFGFVDLNLGPLRDFGGARRRHSYQWYGEWQPRLSLSHLGAWQRSDSAAIRDVFLAAQINLADGGYQALLLGLGHGPAHCRRRHAGLHLYARDDSFNSPTAQLTTFWLAPLGSAGSAWLTEGFLDLAGTDSDGTMSSSNHACCGVLARIGRLASSGITTTIAASAPVRRNSW